MDEGGGDLVLERKVRDTCYSMPAVVTLKFQKSHEITIPCHCNLYITLIYKCKGKKKESQEAGPQARGRKVKLSGIGRENRKTQTLNSISFFFLNLLEKKLLSNCTTHISSSASLSTRAR